MSKDEVTQEELIQLWKRPELKGYEGLLALNELISQQIKINDPNTTRLKKNMPGKITPDMSLSKLVSDVLGDIPERYQGLVNILILPVIEEYTDGKDIYSIRDLSRFLNIKKSTLHRHLHLLHQILSAL